MKYLLSTLLFTCIICFASAQQVIVEGKVTDDQNNRKLTDVEMLFKNNSMEDIKVTTDNFGKYSVTLPVGKDFTIEMIRIAFENTTATYSTKNINTEKVRNDLMMHRLPGYEFQADVKELLSDGIDRRLGKELKNIRIEVYNNISGKEIKVVEDDPKNTFEVNFERGNHYTILLRKKGYYAKRIDVNVDIYGCVLCFEGLGNNYAPEIGEAMEKGNERGILIADIPMRKIVKDEVIRLENIYYDFNKSNIRPDARPALDKLVATLKRNPIVIELGSHTDCRGSDEYNMTLSDKRAQAAVDYMVSRGIKASRVTSQGYGETVPLNNCIDGVQCTDEEYQYNRRTEFKVTAFVDSSSFDNKSLRQILEEEKMNKKRSIEQLEGL